MDNERDKKYSKITEDIGIGFGLITFVFSIMVVISLSYIGVMALLGKWLEYVWIAPIAFTLGGILSFILAIVIFEARTSM